MTIHHTKRHNNATMRRALASIASMQANQYNIVKETVTYLQHCDENVTHAMVENGNSPSISNHTTYSTGNHYGFSI